MTKKPKAPAKRAAKLDPTHSDRSIADTRVRAWIDWVKLAARIPSEHLKTIQRITARPSVHMAAQKVRDGFFRMFESDVAIDAWKALCSTPFADGTIRTRWADSEHDPRFELVAQAIILCGARGPIPSIQRKTATQIRKAFEQAKQYSIELARLIRENATLQHPLDRLLEEKELAAVQQLLRRVADRRDGDPKDDYDDLTREDAQDPAVREDARRAIYVAVFESHEYLATILERFVKVASKAPLPHPIAAKPGKADLDACVFAIQVSACLNTYYGKPLDKIVAQLTQARFDRSTSAATVKGWRKPRKK